MTPNLVMGHSTQRAQRAASRWRWRDLRNVYPRHVAQLHGGARCVLVSPDAVLGTGAYPLLPSLLPSRRHAWYVINMINMSVILFCKLRLGWDMGTPDPARPGRDPRCWHVWLLLLIVLYVFVFLYLLITFYYFCSVCLFISAQKYLLSCGCFTAILLGRSSYTPFALFVLLIHNSPLLLASG